MGKGERVVVMGDLVLVLVLDDQSGGGAL